MNPPTDHASAWLKACPFAVAVLDREGRYLGTSGAWLDQFGGGQDSLVGLRHDLLFPALPADWKEAFVRCMSGEAQRRDQDPCREAAGGTRWLSWEARPWHDPNGQVAGCILHVEDVTARKEAATHLEERGEQLRRILETEPECVKLVDADGILLEMNPAGLAMIESESLEDAIGQNIYSVIVEEHRAAFRELTEATCRGEGGRLQFELEGKKGTRRWMETHTVPFQPRAGGPVHLLAVTRDISSQKRAEMQLRASEERLALATETAGLGVWDWDVVNDTILWSLRCYQIFGLEPGTFGGRYDDFLAVVAPDDLERVRAAVARTVEHGEPYAISFRICWPDGSTRWIAARGRLVVDPRTQAPLRMLGTVMDIDQQVRSEQALEELLAREQTAVRHRDEFLSTASHELKTPIATLLLLLQQLAGEWGPGSPAATPDLNQRIVGTCIRQVGRLIRLVNDLLDVSRIGTGLLTLIREPVDLAAVMKEAAANLAQQAETTGSTLLVHVDGPIMVDCDRLRIEQALTNLLINALKYAPGTIRVIAREDQASYALSVADEGPGVAPELQQQIFQRFDRGAASQALGGLGLGLFITRQILEAHGGTVTLRSTLGEGSTFTLHLPKR